eukprot:m.14072 g.14072  ORF g.14072 m.14072 type:complete len:306 (+) comp6329_c0_seq1:13-930(+)
MADAEIDRLVWEGRLPIAFVLDGEKSANQTENSKPCYMLVSRVSFLALCTEKIRQHFQLPAQQTKEDEVWYEYNGQPLRWNIPVGVLFDSLVPSGTLPWQITVKSKAYPEATLLRCTDMSTLENFFINRVKEATCLKHGTVQVDGIQSLDDKKNLWLGLVQDDFDLFHKIADKLMECRDGHWFRRIPVRIYRPTANGLSIQQVPVLALSEQDKMPVTLADLLTQQRIDGCKVVTHGLEPPLATPLQWICHHLCYPDNFVHITLLPAPAAPTAAAPAPTPSTATASAPSPAAAAATPVPVSPSPAP